MRSLELIRRDLIKQQEVVRLAQLRLNVVAGEYKEACRELTPQDTCEDECKPGECSHCAEVH